MKTFTLTAPEGYFINDAENGLVKTKAYTITVYAEWVEVSGVTIDQGNVKLSAGTEITLTATVEPENAKDKTVTWSSDNTEVADVDATTGVVTAKAVGTATITAASGSVTDTCEVTVIQPILINAVNTDGLVMSTVFPYSVYGNSDGYWSSESWDSYVESPEFYPTLSVLLEGKTEYIDLPVSWVCTDGNGKQIDYDGTATGTTYYFKAVADGY